ncbi:MAG: hypothetical protein WKF85_10510 [Chitinophagaceae bacterium]
MKLLLLFFLVLPIISFGQYLPGFLPEFFFGRQPSARAEAMGKGYVSVDGDLACVYFNPAGVATIKDIEINASYTPPGYYLTKGYYTFYGAGYKLNKYLQIALSRLHFDLGKTQAANANKTPYRERNILTISSQPIKNLLVGLNANYFVWEPGQDNAAQSLYLDFGVIKKFPVLKKKHTVNIAASISNFNYANIKAKLMGIDSKFDLPVITRFGASFESSYGNSIFIDTVKTLKILLQSEYQKLLNSKYRSGIKLGGEIMILNLLSIRAGYYNEKVFNNNLPDDNNSEIEDFTYGLGVQIPLYKIARFPVNLNLDYTSLPQPSYSKTRTNWDNFNTYSLRLSIPLKKKVLTNKVY